MTILRRHPLQPLLLAGVLLLPGPAARAGTPPPAAATQPTLEDAPTIDIHPALAPADEDLMSMRSWHPLYLRELEPVKMGWLRLLQSLAPNVPLRFGVGCDELAGALANLDSEALLPAPDPTVDLYLRRTLRDLKRVAASCRAHRFFEMTYVMEQARTSFVETAERLRTYGLDP